ncbi:MULTISPECIES: hypothetical protein [Alicyclobacillus]|uniref:Uncharacterized protein n=1 Tax=Alicyclobacillus acidoterrestris (strain ATCC 49025 / DSM 3922 / CIP 106132 / NCIMB 13137 / GD3B) TaxID=1356854 RepID=T0DHW0_ALIAG|nr:MULTISPECIES: hypothetical protein [Alicyclobacillus]EPZ50922.1 hypothetical protein N007_20920 [Alicyclobacillus acidoterrestris ATCC 49025]UNO49166.1 hypothetical protein K1I37_00940 [Alicyclobacillus acidoterrestris]
MHTMTTRGRLIPLAIAAMAATPFLMTPSVHAANTQHKIPISISGKQVLSIPSIVAPDPVTGKQTSWLPAMDVETIARNLGLDAHWISGANQLQLLLPVGSTAPSEQTLSYHSPKNNQFITLVNFKPVQYAPVLQQKGQSTEDYLPVYYVMKTFKSLGISSTWNGSAWTFTNAFQTTDASPVSYPLNTTFSLTLANADAQDEGLPTPPVPPASPVTLTLPFISSLKPSTQAFPDANHSIPVEDYVQTGSAEYTIEAPMDSVEAWYKQAFPAQGYHQVGSGQTGNFKTGTYSESLIFAPTSQQSMDPLSVTVSFEPIDNGQTLVDYWVSDVVLPPRPQDTYLPSNVSEVDVTVTGSATASAANSAASGTSGENSDNASMKITDATTIQKLVAAINGLTNVASEGVSSGATATAASNAPNQPASILDTMATLTFITTTGQQYQVTAEKQGQTYLPVTVQGIPLEDNAGTVWTTLEQSVHLPQS